MGAQFSLNIEGIALAPDCTKITFDVSPESRIAAQQAAIALAGKKVRAELRRWVNRRSLDANAFLWVLCQRIAEKVGYTTKEEAYKDAVRAAGVFDVYNGTPEAVESLAKLWGRGRVGSFAEVLGERADGNVDVVLYHGSSVYDSAQMARLLDYVIHEAEELGIPTLPEDDIRTMKELWDAQEKQARASV